jgi:hypothetical protein
LRAIDEFGGAAQASLYGHTGPHGLAPAHVAAMAGQDDILRFLYELGGEAQASLQAPAGRR